MLHRQFKVRRRKSCIAFSCKLSFTTVDVKTCPSMLSPRYRTSPMQTAWQLKKHRSIQNSFDFTPLTFHSYASCLCRSNFFHAEWGYAFFIFIISVIFIQIIFRHWWNWLLLRCKIHNIQSHLDNVNLRNDNSVLRFEQFESFNWQVLLRLRFTTTFGRRVRFRSTRST